MKRFNCDFSSRFRILKGGKISLIVSALLGSAIIASAAPVGGNVTSGNATITQSGNTTNINQTTQKASINWQNFNVGSNETVNFNQPNKNSITLNRVIGNEKSIIDGTLNANGQVWILNSNGILFNSTAKVNTSGLVATTAELSDKDFQDGNYNFKNSKSNSVVNLGTIEVANSGYVVLASNEVRNSGTIKAIKGKVYLSGNSEYTINLNGNSIVNLIVTKGVLDALAENSGTIIANGGEIYLTTNAVNELLKGVVNNTGIIEANSLDDVTGKVEVFAHGGTANVGGEIKAEGGFVETSGKDFNIQPNAKIKAKEWLIDPVNIIIDSTLAGTISTALDTADVTITTDGNNTPSTTSGESGINGDITVASAITWASDNDLTLSAYRNIAINANITATGAGGKLSLLYGQGSANGQTTDNYTLARDKTITLQDGQNFSTRKGTTVGNIKNYTVISSLGVAGDTSATTLQGIKSNLTSNFALGANIDASATSTWNSGAGFVPIGDGTTAFSGLFDGLGHTINNLTINRPTTNSIGLFGRTTNTFRGPSNIGVINATISGKSIVGALGGEVNTGSVYNAWSSGSIIGNGNYVGGLIGYSYAVDSSYSTASVSLTGSFNSIGGLVGYHASGSLTNSYATGSVTTGASVSKIGGLVGSTSSSITNSYATGNINAQSTNTYVGGLVGYSTTGGSISTSYATGNITGAGSSTGGLVGAVVTGATISNSYATGNVSGTSQLGGLVGSSNKDITNSYATGNVTGTAHAVGGLVGLLNITATVSSSYATGNVTGTFYVGGLVAWLDSGRINNSYALGNVTGSDASVGGIGGLVGEMENSATITTSYAAGSVGGTGGKQGGLVGWIYTANASITNSYWDKDSTGNPNAVSYNIIGGTDTGNIGIQSTTTTINAYTQATYANLDFTAGTGKWYMVDGKTRPFLQSEYSTTINNTHQLQLIGMNTTTLAATYTQANNIDFVSTTAMKMWNPNNYFVPIGNVSADFKGIYDGNNKTISNLQINNNGASRVDYLGLFGQTYSTAVLKNIGIESGTINTTQGSYYLGGLVGMNQGLIENSYSKANLTGNGNDVGGLVGMNMNSTANIRYSYSAGSVHGDWYVGGFAGQNSGNAQISNSYSIGNVVADYWSLGGFIGTNAASVTNSYSTGSVTSTYATASGQASQVGGFIGESSGGIYSGNFWDNQTSKATSAGSGVGMVGKTTAQMKTKSTFSDAGWDFTSIWGIKTDGSVNNGYPVLRGTYTGTGVVFSTPITITLNGNLTKTYGDANPTINYTSDNGSVTLNWGTAMTQWTNVGTYAFSSTSNIFAPVYGTGTADDYTITWNYGSYGITVSPYVLSLSNFATSNKTYNGTITASVSGTLGTALNGDTVNLTGTFADKNVATGKIVTAALSNANYTLGATPITTTADITAKALTISGLTSANKVYDGTTTAVVNGTAVFGTETTGSGNTSDGKAYTGDTVSITGTAVGTFNDKDVADANTVTFSGLSLTGAEAGNYTLTPHAIASHTISAKALTISGLTSANKVYDGTTTAVVNGTAVFGTETTGSGTTSDGKAYTTDTVSLTGTASGAFNDKDVADANTVTFSGLSLTGAEAGNYTLTPHATALNTISAKALTISGLTSANKVYDGTTTAVVNGTAVFGTETTGSGTTSDGKAYTTDTVSLTGTASGAFNDKDVADANTVTFSGLSLTGAEAGNYTLTPHATALNTISAKALTAITGITASNKEYNGLTSATINYVSAGFTGKETGDILSISSATGTFDDKNVGTGKTVTISDIVLGGADAGNYSIVGLTSPTTTANITTKAITLTAPDVTKTYDGGLAYTATASELTTLASSLVGSDTLTSITLAFTDKNAGTDNKTLNASSAVINDGNSGNNYSVTYASNTTSTIEKIALTLSGATASNRAYNGNTNTTMSSWGTLTGVLGTEDVTINHSSATALFADKNVGDGKTVNILGITLGGADAGNYSAGSSMTATANITKADITAITGITASNKEYNGTTDVILSTSGASFTGKIGSDNLTVATSTGAFDNKNVGTGKTVNITSLTLGGIDAGNYNLTSTVATTTANITTKAITLTAPDVTKTYDGGLAYTATASELTTLASSLVGSDTLTSITLAFTDKNAGTDNKTLNASSAVINDGNSGNNYSVTYASNTTSTITPKTVSLSASKTYDGTTDLTNFVTINTGITGEALTYTNATSSSAQASTSNKYINAITLTDGTGLASNYALPILNNTNASVIITEKPVVVTLPGSSTPTGTFGTPIVLPTATSNDVNAPISVKVFDSNNNDVTAQATAGTLGAGTYTIKPVGTSSNYSISDVSSTLTIGAKTVTPTLSSSTVSGTFGTALTLPTVTLSDSNASSTTNVKVFDSNHNDVTAQATAGTLGAGTYTIKPVGTSSNYSISDVSSTLTIQPKTVVASSSKSSITTKFGQNIEFPTYSFSDNAVTTEIKVFDKNGNDVTTDANAKKLQPGQYTIKAISDNNDYLISDSGTSLIINSAVDTATFVKVPEVVLPSNIVATQQISTLVRTPVSLPQNNSLTQGFSNIGLNLTLVSVPVENQATKAVTMSEVKAMQTNSNSSTTNESQKKDTPVVQDTRVALSSNSVIDLVNGGVNLPSGVDQVFYITETKENKKAKGTNK